MSRFSLVFFFRIRFMSRFSLVLGSSSLVLGLAKPNTRLSSRFSLVVGLAFSIRFSQLPAPVGEGSIRFSLVLGLGIRFSLVIGLAFISRFRY